MNEKEEKNDSKSLIIIVIILIAVLLIARSLTGKGKDNQNQNWPNKEIEEMGKNGGDSTPRNMPGNSQRGGFDLSNIDYTLAAEKLGVTEEDLKEALTVEAGEPLDLEGVAVTLGVSIEDLRDALGMPEMGNMKNPVETDTTDSQEAEEIE